MTKEVDWLELWRELVSRKLHPETESLVQKYRPHGQKHNERPDSLLDFVLKKIDPEDTAVDIGAGTGRWTIPLARKTRNVTAIEPVSGMVAMLKENLDYANIKNVKILLKTWEDAALPVHDTAVCAHGMYGSPDLAEFVRKMERLARKGCYLAMRLPPADGILSELSLQIYGCRHDSPDAMIAYNALYTMGIDVNILVETSIVNWFNQTMEDAFIRAKRHLRIQMSDTTYDDLIHSTLKRRLNFSDGAYIWPDGMRSALLWWTPVH